MSKSFIKTYQGYHTYVNTDGKLHREDGPAIVWDDGDKFWYYKGMRHRIGGPASETLSILEWIRMNKRHRLNAPAVKFIQDKNKSKYWEFGILIR
jgi:hypothetical protein